MSEWKELKTGNIPRDILIGDYEFHEGFKEMNNYGEISEEGIISILGYMVCQHHHKFFYRKRQPRPTHEEIITKWWLDGWCWLKVIGVNQKQYFIFSARSDDKGYLPMMLKSVDKKWFTGRKSSDIPPEAEC